jgi:hypothetical protein
MSDRFAHSVPTTQTRRCLSQRAARAYHDKQCARGLGDNSALRQLSNRLVGTLARLPESPYPLRRGNRLGGCRAPRSLTFNPLGCLPAAATAQIHAPAMRHVTDSAKPRIRTTYQARARITHTDLAQHRAGSNGTRREKSQILGQRLLPAVHEKTTQARQTRVPSPSRARTALDEAD